MLTSMRHRDRPEWAFYCDEDQWHHVIGYQRGYLQALLDAGVGTNEAWEKAWVEARSYRLYLSTYLASG